MQINEKAREEIHIYIYTTIQSWNNLCSKDLCKSFGPTIVQRTYVENRLASEVFSSVLNTPRKRDTTVFLDKLF